MSDQGIRSALCTCFAPGSQQGDHHGPGAAGGGTSLPEGGQKSPFPPNLLFHLNSQLVANIIRSGKAKDVISLRENWVIPQGWDGTTTGSGLPCEVCGQLDNLWIFPAGERGSFTLPKAVLSVHCAGVNWVFFMLIARGSEECP